MKIRINAKGGSINGSSTNPEGLKLLPKERKNIPSASKLELKKRLLKQYPGLSDAQALGKAPIKIKGKTYYVNSLGNIVPLKKLGGKIYKALNGWQTALTLAKDAFKTNGKTDWSKVVSTGGDLFNKGLAGILEAGEKNAELKALLLNALLLSNLQSLQSANEAASAYALNLTDKMTLGFLINPSKFNNSEWINIHTGTTQIAGGTPTDLSLSILSLQSLQNSLLQNIAYNNYLKQRQLAEAAASKQTPGNENKGLEQAIMQDEKKKATEEQTVDKLSIIPDPTEQLENMQGTKLKPVKTSEHWTIPELIEFFRNDLSSDHFLSTPEFIRKYPGSDPLLYSEYKNLYNRTHPQSAKLGGKVFGYYEDPTDDCGKVNPKTRKLIKRKGYRYGIRK